MVANQPMSQMSQRSKGGGSSHLQTRIVWADAARTAAIILVVLCHVTESCYSLSIEEFNAYSTGSQIVASLFFVLGRTGVPLFLLLTGFLQLKRRYDDEGCLRFWRTKWLPLLAVTEAWVIIYNVFLHVFSGQELTVYGIAKNMLFLEYVNMGNFWYMPMILGLMLFLPIIANGLQSVNEKTLAFPLVLLAFVFLGFPVLSLLWQFVGGEPFSSTINPGFGGGAFGCYLIMGLLVYRGSFKRIPSSILAVSGIAALVVLVIFQIEAHAYEISYNLAYENILLAIEGLCIFELASRTKTRKIQSVAARVLKTTSSYAFAVYLIHLPTFMLIKPIVIKFMEHFPILQMTSIEVIALTALTYGLSLIAASIVARIPKVGKWILYLK